MHHNNSSQITAHNRPIGTPNQKISVFCALSQNYQRFYENDYASDSKLFEEIKNRIRIQVGLVVLE